MIVLPNVVRNHSWIEASRRSVKMLWTEDVEREVELMEGDQKCIERKKIEVSYL